MRDPRKGMYKTAVNTNRWYGFKNFIEKNWPSLIYDLCGKRYDYPKCVNPEKEIFNLTRFQGYLWNELRFWEQKIRISNSIDPDLIKKKKK